MLWLALVVCGVNLVLGFDNSVDGFFIKCFHYCKLFVVCLLFCVCLLLWGLVNCFACVFCWGLLDLEL